LDKVGILIVSKCLSAAAIIDTFARSERYRPEFYVVEKQVNPFNFERAKVHSVVPDLNLAEVARFASAHSKDISFGLTDTEDFVTAGGRDLLEKEAKVPMLCVSKEFAIERSKADQRILFERICPKANPRYKVFDPAEYADTGAAVADLRRFSKELADVRFAIKPDAPARGAGVGVWGKDFRTEDEAVDFFRNVYSKGRVVVEERIEGQESSFHAFSDGRHFIPAPLTRDYKRALDGEGGKLTGGMGSYRGTGHALPFLRSSEWESVLSFEKEAFERWKGRGSNPGLRGIVVYDALMHTRRGFKILERNCRGGNTEQVCFLTTMLDDYVDVCYRMVEGNLKGIRFSNKASVVTCAVPLGYGLPPASPSAAPASLPTALVAGAGEGGEKRETVDLDGAFALEEELGSDLRILPMDLTFEGGAGGRGKVLMGSSRSVAVAGIGASVEEARVRSLEGIAALGKGFRHRDDVGSAADISRSREHLRRIRASRAR
jgi:phosphoribosylamine---glycine ligase